MLPRMIILDNPGNYKLIGSTVSTSLDTNYIVKTVDTGDRIFISESGEFNVVIENVTIISKHDDFREYPSTTWRQDSPLIIGNNAIVNLTLKGNNILKSYIKESDGLYVSDGSRLVFTRSSEGASLEVSGFLSGISAERVILKGGKITAIGGSVGVSIRNSYVNNLERIGLLRMEGGNMIALQDSNMRLRKRTPYIPIDINNESNLEINGGEIKADNIIVKNIKMDGGRIDTKNFHIENDIEVRNGEINANNIIVGRNVVLTGGKIHTDNIEILDKSKITLNRGVLDTNNII